MPVNSIAVKTAPTSYTVTGGTSLPLVAQVDFGMAQLVPAADTDFRTRRTIKISSKDPKVNAGAPNGFTQQRSSTNYVRPVVLANGKITANGFDVNFHWDVETTDAEKIADLDMLSQLSVDANWRAAVKSGNMNA